MTVSATPVVEIDEAPLTTADLVAIARGSRLALGPTAVDRIRASRAVVDRLVDGDALIYGLNTGLGHMRNDRLPREALEELQAIMVAMHAGAIGDALPTEVVRAAMAARVAGIARGGSGASLPIAETYVAMLNAGVHPRVPVVGSIGAADLMHMAAIALVAIGQGEAEIGGEVVPGAEALARAGIGPIRLAPKDGLTVISANGVAIGHAALVVDRAMALVDVADLLVALSLEAIRGNPSIVEDAVARAKPVPGQAVSAARIRAFLEGSGVGADGGAASVQDPLSFRVAPQVHGAFREVVRFAREAVDGELAAMDDNPLVAVAEDRMISNGNFHPMLLALAVDAIRPALAHLGQLSDRRAGQIWDRLVSDPSSFSSDGFERLSRWGNPLVRYSGAARAAELRTLAGPATLDVVPLDLNVEDHATNAPLAARRTDEALSIAFDVLAVELLTAGAVIGWHVGVRDEMGPRTRAALDRLGEAIQGLGAAAPGGRAHAAARALLDGDLLRAAEDGGAARP